PDSYGMPLVKRYVDVAQEDLDGFSTNPVVFFRFSHPYNKESVQCPMNGPCTVKIVNITKGSPGYDDKGGLERKTTKNHVSNDTCPHCLAVRRSVGSPLLPNTTYAAIITKGIQSEDGGNFARGADFGAMLGSSAPSDADMKAAYEAYAPLRAWISDT